MSRGFTLVIVLVALCALSACSTSGGAVTVHYTAYYFHNFDAPGDSNVPPICATSDDSSWYLYMNIDSIENTTAYDFTFDQSNLQPIYPQRDNVELLWLAYLDSYWTPAPVTVPAGQTFTSAQVHQGRFFEINFGTPTPDSTLQDIPPIVYHSTEPYNVIFLSNAHQEIQPAAQPTNDSEVDHVDQALVPSGPCTP